MPKCAVGCVDLGNVAEQFLCVWNDFHVFIMLTRYLVEDSSSTISHQFHKGWDCSAGYRGCSGTAGGKKCHWKKCSRNQIFTFLSFIDSNIYSKDASFDFETKERNLSHGFLHKGRSIEIYNKQCWVLLFCKKSEFLGVHWSNWFVFLTYILDHFESSNKGKLGRDQLPEGRLLTPASRGNLKPMKNEIHCKLK